MIRNYQVEYDDYQMDVIGSHVPRTIRGARRITFDVELPAERHIVDAVTEAHRMGMDDAAALRHIANALDPVEEDALMPVDAQALPEPEPVTTGRKGTGKRSLDLE